jgi:hypothetical protein
MRLARSALLLLLTPAVLAAPPSHEVDFQYQKSGDESCLGKAVAPAWDLELRERLPEFVSLWRAVGPAMAQAVVKITGQPFAPPSKVTLTLCETPSNSFFGVTVNMRYALRSFTASPVPLRYKIDTVFHEMLHQFVSRNTPRDSALLAAYSSESLCVRNHLHLLALQKSVLIAAGEAAELEQVVSLDSLLPSGCYKRAWAIVNAEPSSYQAYVAEIAQ